jgi:uncharacterized membrane protein
VRFWTGTPAGLRRLLIGYAAYILILGGLAVYRWHIWAYGTDTGAYAQMVADAFGGFHSGPDHGTFFRFHWSPLLAALWPLIAVTHSPLSLQLALIALSGASAFPLYAIARNYVAEPRAASYAAIAFVYPPLLGVAFFEFHELSLFPVLALAVMWAADRARWLWFGIFGFLAALVREDACLVMICAGLMLALVAWLRRNVQPGAGLLADAPLQPKRLFIAGLALAALNATAVIFYFELVVPHAGGWHPSSLYDYPFAHGPLALVGALVAHPEYLAQIATFGRLTYLIEAFAPLAFLPLLSRWSLLALPGFVILLLSSTSLVWQIGVWYPSLWIPWLLIGAIAALVAIEHLKGTRVAARWRNAAFGISAIVLIAFDPLHPGYYLKQVYPRDDAVKALASVPRDESLATHDEWFTQIALSHPNSTTVICPEIHYVVWADDFPNSSRRPVYRILARELSSGHAWLVRRFGRVGVYERRVAPARPNTDCDTNG